MSRCPPPRVDWFNVTVWTLLTLYCLALLGLAGLGVGYLAGWLP